MKVKEWNSLIRLADCEALVLVSKPTQSHTCKHFGIYSFILTFVDAVKFSVEWGPGHNFRRWLSSSCLIHLCFQREKALMHLASSVNNSSVCELWSVLILAELDCRLKRPFRGVPFLLAAGWNDCRVAPCSHNIMSALTFFRTFKWNFFKDRDWSASFSSCPVDLLSLACFDEPDRRVHCWHFTLQTCQCLL